jgi:hypothetical protein
MLGLGISLTQVATRGGRAPIGPQILISNRFQDENTAIGTTIGTFTVVGGTGTYTFSKTADPSSAFTLTGAALKNAIVFDYETATSYSVTINANNGAGSSINRTLTVGVNDIDEVPPVILTSSTQTVAENAGFAVVLTADKTVTWTKTGGADAALFTLASDNLSLPAKDFEAPDDADGNNTYVVQVTATPSSGSTYATNKTITVTITDVSDTLPAPGTPTIVWTSDVDVSPPIFSFSAPTDADLVVGDTVRFQRSTASDFSLSVTAYTNTVDSGEDLANALTFSSGTWADGTWYVRARTERTGATNSDWSNTVTKTIATVSAFDPTSLFSSNTGGWWDPSDHSTTWQDVAGTTPATAAGDPVARIDDKSGNGNHLLQATSGNRPILRTSSGLWYLEFDGVNDSLARNFTHVEPITRMGTYQDRSPVNSYCRIYSGGTSVVCDVSHLGGSTGIYQIDSTGTFSTINNDWSQDTVLVLTDVRNTSSTSLKVNNGTAVVTSMAASNAGGFIIAADGGGGSNEHVYFYGAISIGRLLTGTEPADCRTFFGAKGGLTL